MITMFNEGINQERIRLLTSKQPEESPPGGQ